MNPPAADQSGYTGRALCCQKQTWYGTTACGKQIQAPRGHKRSASQKPPCSKNATASVHNGPTVHNLPVLRLLGQKNLTDLCTVLPVSNLPDLARFRMFGCAPKCTKSIATTVHSIGGAVQVSGVAAHGAAESDRLHSCP